MTPRELFDAAMDTEQKGLTRVILKVKRKSPPRSENIRLAGPGSPICRVVGCHEDGTYIVDANAAKLLGWLVAVVAKAGTPEGAEHAE